MQKSLANITVADLGTAQTKNLERPILPAGEYTAKVLGFVEEDNYNYVSLEINGVKYNFFYNYFLSIKLDCRIIYYSCNTNYKFNWSF